MASNEEIRIVLIGKTGSGKSSTANTITRKAGDIDKKFKEYCGFDSKTRKMQCEKVQRYGDILKVVDTPGLFENRKSQLDDKDVLDEIKKAFIHLSPGPHAIILVLSGTSRYSDQDRETANIFTTLLGKAMVSFLLVVFTGGDDIKRMETNIDKLVRMSEQEDLKTLLQRCKGRYLLFDNRATGEESEKQVKELIDLILANIKKNGGKYYSNSMFISIEEYLQGGFDIVKILTSPIWLPFTLLKKGPTKLRILLFGLQGSGVSSTANTIIGEARFRTGLSFEPITTYCTREASEIFGRQVEIIDTPGFPNAINVDTVDNAFCRLKQGFEMLEPGPNVFILVLPIQRFNDDSKLMLECLDKYDDIKRHVIVIFTGIDKVEQPLEKTKQDIINSESLRELLQFASGRFIMFNNRVKDANQVKTLLESAEVVSKNYSHFMDSRIFNERSVLQMKRIVEGKNETWCPIVINSVKHKCNIL